MAKLMRAKAKEKCMNMLELQEDLKNPKEVEKIKKEVEKTC